jgi:Domain of unknown function (DUF4169)
MNEIVNLRLARKRRQRAEKEAAVAQNRLTHGRSKAEKTQVSAARALSDKRLEAHRRDDDSGSDG